MGLRALLHLLSITTLLIAGTAPAAPGDGVQWSGPPVLRGKALPTESYEEVRVRRLAKAEVVWVNRDWLRAQGYDVKARGPVPKTILDKVLQSFAWSAVNPGDPSSAFTEESATFYADRYGGGGTGIHHGSGRAASVGSFQIKGIGITPLRIAESGRFDHVNGRASLEEALREAVNSELNAAELPNGSNRVVAVIRSGLHAKHAGVIREEGALIVREDPLRPAHLLRNRSTRGTEEQKEKKIKAVEKVWKNPPWKEAGLLPEDYSEPLDRAVAARDALFEFAERVARQQAQSFARGIFHGALTPSNIELSGRSLDFGTQTYNPTFRALRVQKDTAAMVDGDISYIFNAALSEITKIAGDLTHPESRGKAPSIKEIQNHFLSVWGITLREELLELTGVPRKSWDHRKGYEVAQELGRALESAVIQEQKLSMNDRSTLDLKTLLMSLARMREPTLERVSAAVAERMPDRALAAKLTEAYVEFRTHAQEYALNDGISVEAWNELIVERARRFLAPRSGLERNTWIIANRKFLVRRPSPSDFQDFVDETIRSNRRFGETSSDYVAVLSRGFEPNGSREIQVVFDAKRNATFAQTLGSDSAPLPISSLAEAKSRFRLTELPAIRVDSGGAPNLAKCLLQGLSLNLPWGTRSNSASSR